MRFFRPSLQAFKVPLPYALPVLAVIAVFAVFPQIDLIVSGWFYDPARGGFWLGKNPLVLGIGHFTGFASAAFVGLCFLLYLYGIPRKRVYWGVNRKLVVYFSLVMIIGPLLLVSLGFKEFWGRPRPVDTVDFGGTYAFTAFYTPSHACDSDCSFPSGHSARAFFFLALAFAAYRLHPKRSTAHSILTLAILFGLMTAVQRVIAGRHFITDVTMSAFILAYVSWVLYRLMWPPHSTQPKLPDVGDVAKEA